MTTQKITNFSLILFTSLIAALLASPQPAPASYIYYPAALDTIDSDFMARYYDEIINRQNAYYNNNGQYFQGLRTHLTTPAAGTPEVADMLTSEPTDQLDNWLDFWPQIPASMDYSIEIHTHRNPSGYGYTIILRAYDGIDYYIKHRSIGVGGKDSGWEKGR